MTGKGSHATFRKTSKEESSTGGGFRVFPALFGLVVLISLIAVAFVLRKLRDEHMNLRAEVVSELNSTVHPEESSLTGLQAQLGALERRLKEEEDAKGAIRTNRARGKNIERRPAIGARTNGHV